MQTGKVMDEMKKYSLVDLLLNCKDFVSEKSDLEQLAAETSASVGRKHSLLFTPKLHCELVGEGIGYYWGVSKRMYRKQPLSTRRFTVNFEKLVCESLRRVSKLMARRCWFKARSYMLSYYHNPCLV